MLAIYRDVDFGDAFAGLVTVGYQITDATGAIVVARTIVGVFEIGHGKYGASVTIPAVDFVGSIYWDTVAGGVINACEVIDNGFNYAYSMPGQVTPPLTPSLAQAIMQLYQRETNPMDQDGTTQKIYNRDGTVVHQKRTTFEAGGVVSIGPVTAGP